MNIVLNVVVEQRAEQCIDHNCGILRCLAVYFRPWSDSLLLDADAGTVSEHSVVLLSIHSWITAVTTSATHKRTSSTFGNGEYRHPTRPPTTKTSQNARKTVFESHAISKTRLNLYPT